VFVIFHYRCFVLFCFLVCFSLAKKDKIAVCVVLVVGAHIKARAQRRRVAMRRGDATSRAGRRPPGATSTC
jgi:hypothetical protein